MQFNQKNISLAGHWEPLSLTLVQNEGCGNSVPDIGVWHNANLILSPKAVDVLRAYLEPNGELLPVTLDSEQYYIFNCLNEVEPDLSKSKRVVEGRYFMDVESLVFADDISAAIFKTPFDNNRSLFCSEDFKNAVETDELGGIYFGRDLAAFM